MSVEREPSTEGALRVRRRPARTRAAVLVLHGGRAESRSAARPWQLAALRMRPFLRALEAATGRDDVLLARVRYRSRGWNGAAAEPLRDTRRALAELHGLAGDVPVVLLGHSMGGRAALRAAGADRVRGVVALAPWCPPGEPVAQLRDRDVLVLHGSRDRVTDPAESAAYVARARGAGARAGMLLLEDGDHAMLRHHARWHRTATAAVAHLLDAEAAPCELYGQALAAAEPPVLRPGRHTTSDLGPGPEPGPVREPGC
ncbi:alpha/beta fold hydrolase [Streptomyces mayonensis]|uniref:alpha/beta fold hydrolase n=1 Tax=Streptomyces mayonensis TaxID=2750816 RepID=UPI001C1E434E|nr:alpha/beta fold hydrolase [Streptomyces sp. A108]MBU6532630.1 alpha/beta fold hydrolase [Streptomyces sp. A108]